MSLLVRPKINTAKVLGIVAVAAICVLPFAVYLDSKKPLKNTDVPAPTSQPSAPVSVTVAPTATLFPEIGSRDVRLQAAADIRHALEDNDVPALVVSREHERCLLVHYKVALIEYAPDTFIRHQGKEGLKRLAEAGFVKVRIEANREDGGTGSQDIYLSSVTK